MTETKWYQLDTDKVAGILKTNKELGLSVEEAKQRFSAWGPNKMVEEKKKSPWKIFVAQFKDFMVITLLVAAVISGFLGGVADTITIMAIVLANAILGFIQEYRAEKSIATLKKLSALEARVIREGKAYQIPAVELVAGDMVSLEAGTR
ncbi:MAG: ATPase, partial [Syntrophomonadaceae bacterium]|nr:ATPase [Syntrophomonadaceae bacterium]